MTLSGFCLCVFSRIGMLHSCPVKCAEVVRGKGPCVQFLQIHQALPHPFQKQAIPKILEQINRKINKHIYSIYYPCLTPNCFLHAPAVSK